MSDDPIEVVVEVAAAFRYPIDLDRIVRCFTEDGVFHNMPMEPWVGRAEIRERLAEFMRPIRGIDIEIANIAAVGDRVYAERVDWIESHDGTRAPLPCNGVFEIRDGRIAAWRDYFDITQIQRNRETARRDAAIRASEP